MTSIPTQPDSLSGITVPTAVAPDSLWSVTDAVVVAVAWAAWTERLNRLLLDSATETNDDCIDSILFDRVYTAATLPVA